MAWVIFILGLLALGVWDNNGWFYVAAIFFGTIGTLFYVALVGALKVAVEQAKQQGNIRRK